MESTKNIEDLKDTNNSWLTIWLTLFVLVQIVMLGYLTHINLKLNERISNVEQQNDEFISRIEISTRKEMASRLEQLSGNLKDIAETSLNKSFTKINKELNVSIAESIAVLQSNLDSKKQATNKIFDQAQQQYIKELSDINVNLEKASNSVIKLAEARILKNEANAEAAFIKAKEYIEVENLEYSRVYLINAINHNPSEIKYLSELFNLAVKYYSSDFDNLNQVKSIIELSLFQLEPKSIETAQIFLNELDSIERKFYSAQLEVSEEKINWFKEYKDLPPIILSDISEYVVALEERFTVLQTILTNMRNQESIDEEKFSLVSEVSEDVRTTYNVSVVADKVNNYLNLLEAQSDYNSRSASARLLAASSSMSLFWEYDLTQLPEKLSNFVTNKLPDRLESIEKKIQQEKSSDSFEKAKQVLASALNFDSNIFQEKIVKKQEAIESVIRLLATTISFKEYQDEIQIELRSIKKSILEDRQSQYIEYQKWASDVCLKLSRKIEEELPFDDDDAIKFFNHSEISKIDLRLTSPEVGQAYNQTLQKVLTELPWRKASKIHKAVMTNTKKSMESF